jgi:hypothetical protein
MINSVSFPFFVYRMFLSFLTTHYFILHTIGPTDLLHHSAALSSKFSRVFLIYLGNVQFFCTTHSYAPAVAYFRKLYVSISCYRVYGRLSKLNRYSGLMSTLAIEERLLAVWNVWDSCTACLTSSEASCQGLLSKICRGKMLYLKSDFKLVCTVSRVKFR